MPNLFSNLRECLGFSQIMNSTFFRVSLARKLMSLRFPMGVDIIYKMFSRLFIHLLLTIIISCSPQNFVIKNTTTETNLQKNEIITLQKDEVTMPTQEKEIISDSQKLNVAEITILNEVEVILPKNDNLNITKDFINAFELSLYQKNIKNLKLNVNQYSNEKELSKIILQKAKPGKIFIGPLTSKDTKNLIDECSKGVLFFSFASNRNYSGKCIYLINFFPEDDLITLFNSFDPNAKIALLYPENDYGHYINSIIDSIALKSGLIIINRASYKEDLSNAREAIKELSKYELRKYELDRQKKILRSKDDEISAKALKKIEKFETAGLVEFTHLLLPDYSIRLLQIAPLLPFYDVDPSKVQFVGTGVWDNEAFFNEPSLQGSIFPGVDRKKRSQFIYNYQKNYKSLPTRTITISYDLIGLLNYIIENKLSMEDTHKLLNDNNATFDGIDGRFSFKNNIISRELNILKIFKGRAKLIK